MLLLDPIVPADAEERARFWRALDHDVARVGTPHVVLTCAWHARSARDVLARYAGARLWTHADGLDELPVGMAATDPFRPGDALPGSASAFAGAVGGPVTDVLVWLPSHAALVSGDTLLGDGADGVRLCPDSWLEAKDAGVVRAEMWAQVRDLPVERVLVSHGEPILAGGRDALAAALGE